MKTVRILLIDVNRISLDTSIDMLEYPLGLVYVATAIKKELGDRVEVGIRSFNDKVDSEETVRAWLEEFKPEIVGLRSLTMGRKPLHAIANLARSWGAPLVMAGGPHATDSPQDVLDNEVFDCAVLGEGEETASAEGRISDRITGYTGLSRQSCESCRSILASLAPWRDTNR